MKNTVGVAKRNAAQELVQKALQDCGLKATIAYIKVLLKILVEILKNESQPIICVHNIVKTDNVRMLKLL
jgi:hypothetical protein